MGNGDFRERQERRVRIRVDNGREEQAAGVVMTFTNFFRSFFKQDTVTTRDGCARQVGVLVVTTAQQAEEFSFLLLLVAGARGGSGSSISETGSFLQSALDSRVQLSN